MVLGEDVAESGLRQCVSIQISVPSCLRTARLVAPTMTYGYWVPRVVTIRAVSTGHWLTVLFASFRTPSTPEISTTRWVIQAGPEIIAISRDSQPSVFGERWVPSTAAKPDPCRSRMVCVILGRWLHKSNTLLAVAIFKPPLFHLISTKQWFAKQYIKPPRFCLVFSFLPV